MVMDKPFARSTNVCSRPRHLRPKVARRNERGFGLACTDVFFCEFEGKARYSVLLSPKVKFESLFLLVLNIKARCSVLHCNFGLFDVLGRAMCVEPVCLNLDVPVSTIY